MIMGVGVDLVDVARFERQLTATPRLVERLFAFSERGLEVRSLAARFAAKEALVKALGSPEGLSWVDIAVVKNSLGNPDFELVGLSAQTVANAGVSKLHLSLSHDGGMAMAMVVAEA